MCANNAGAARAPLQLFKDLRSGPRHAVIAEMIVLRYVSTDWHPKPDTLINTVRACVSVATGEGYKPQLIACHQSFEVPDTLTTPWYALFDPVPQKRYTAPFVV